MGCVILACSGQGSAIHEVPDPCSIDGITLGDAIHNWMGAGTGAGILFGGQTRSPTSSLSSFRRNSRVVRLSS